MASPYRLSPMDALTPTRPPGAVPEVGARPATDRAAAARRRPSSRAV